MSISSFSQSIYHFSKAALWGARDGIVFQKTVTFLTSNFPEKITPSLMDAVRFGAVNSCLELAVTNLAQKVKEDWSENWAVDTKEQFDE